MEVWMFEASGAPRPPRTDNRSSLARQAGRSPRGVGGRSASTTPRSAAPLALALALALAWSLLPATVAAPAARASSGGVVGGWFGYWTNSTAIKAAAQRGSGTLAEPMIFMWKFAGSGNPACTIDPYDGGCTSGSTTERYTLSRKALQAQGMEVYGSHTDLDYRRARQLSNYLASASNRQSFANLLTSRVVSAGVDGLDLDWENFAFNDGSSTWGATKSRFVDMVKRLSAALHQRGKKLSVTVPGGYAPYSGGRPNAGGGYWVYAWKEIAPSIDKLRLMTYDYSLSSPQGIGPNNWAEQVVTSAKAQLGRGNAHKIWVGAAQYGRDWVLKTSSGRWWTDNCPSNWAPNSRTFSRSLESVRSVQRREGVSGSWNSSKGEYSFRYWEPTSGGYYSNGTYVSRSCTVRREVWYSDQRSAQAKLGLVGKHGIGGVAVWQLAALESNFYSAGLAQLAARTSGSGGAASASIVASAPVTADFGATGALRAAVTFQGAAHAGQRLRIVFVGKDGDKQLVGTYRTNQRGAVEVPHTFRESGNYVFYSPPGQTPAFRQDVAVAVSPHVAVGALPSNPAPKQSTTVSGNVYPAQSGARVVLQVNSGGWKTVQVRKTTRRGAFAFPVSGSNAVGTRAYRVRVKAGSQRAPGEGAVSIKTVSSAAARTTQSGLRVELSGSDDLAKGSRALYRSKLTRNGVPLAGKRVYISMVPSNPDLAPVWIGGALTNSAGIANHWIRVPAKATLIARNGKGETPRFRDELPVLARQQAALTVSQRAPRAGKTVEFVGYLSPARAGATVRRQIFEDGRWQTKSRTTTNAAGRFAFQVNLYSQPQRYFYRVTVTGNTTVGKAVSPTLVFTAR